jgi:hypothetical protein
MTGEVEHTKNTLVHTYPASTIVLQRWWLWYYACHLCAGTVQYLCIPSLAACASVCCRKICHAPLSTLLPCTVVLTCCARTLCATCTCLVSEAHVVFDQATRICRAGKKEGTWWRSVRVKTTNKQKKSTLKQTTTTPHVRPTSTSIHVCVCLCLTDIHDARHKEWNTWWRQFSYNRYFLGPSDDPPPHPTPTHPPTHPPCSRSPCARDCLTRLPSC